MEVLQHPLSAAFPAMSEEEYRGLVGDIQKHGQRDVAVLYEGMVLDGWHRYRACDELGIECNFEAYQGDDAVAFVRSKNQHRRHYQKSQLAAIEVALSSWADSHRPNKGAPGAPLSTNKDMAARAGTGVRTIKHAKRAEEAGLGEFVRSGEISAKQAAEIAKADPGLAKKVANGEVALPKAVENLTGKKGGNKGAPGAPLLADESPAYDPREDELAEAHETVRQLAAENDALKDRLAVEVMPGGEDDKTAALNTITELRARVVALEAELEAVKASRDTYMREAGAMKAQIAMQRKEIDKLKKGGI